jgi:hypothetical protein
MSPAARIAAFLAALAVVFAGAVVVGGAADPDVERASGGHGETGGGGEAGGAAHGEEAGGGHGEAHSSEDAPHGAGAHAVRGLGVADDSHRLALSDRELPVSGTVPLYFRILDREGETVRDFDVAHTKRMHLIVVRRDLTHFQHLHPEQEAEGRWTVPLRLTAPGSYRVFADFELDGEPHTLGSDLQVAGNVEETTAAPETAARSDLGVDVRVEGAARAGHPSTLRFSLPVDVQEYLGAGGHLVALREGDLAFLHVHPTAQRPGEVSFEATFPTPGRYALFLQFRHGGRVDTVALTQVVR